MIPDCIADIYDTEGEWIPYIQDSYLKLPCKVRTLDGKESGVCWPNANKFVSMEEDDQPDIPESKVTEIKYYS